MKKILLALFVLLSLNAFAQFDGTPFYFCTLSGEQYNPGTHGDSHLVQDKWVVTVDDYTQSERFYKVRNQFNGYVELFNRDDFIQELITLYSSRDVSFVENINNDYERGQYSFDYKIMEIMMLEVLDSVPNQRSNQMAKIVSEKQSQKAAYKEYYSNSNAAKQIINKSTR